MSELAPSPLWVDTDLALGSVRGDVDDGYALAAILGARAELRGVSSVFGNTRADEAARCARALLAEAGRRIAVVEGASAPGLRTPAAEAIAVLPAGTHILALGPLTNVAQALRIDPGLAERAVVHLVGGNLSSWGRWPPWWPFEFNLAKDAVAATEVFASPIPRCVYPLDVCQRLRIGPTGLRRLAQTSALGAYLARHSLRWLAYAPLRYRSLRFPLWDLVPALNVLGRPAMRVEGRRLALRGRGLLVDDAHAQPAQLVALGEPRRALDELFALLSST